jgi:hypothetical protein
VKNDARDIFIMVLIALSVATLLAIAWRSHDGVTVGAVCGAVPTILGLFHWGNIRDAKTPDAQQGGQ